MVVQATGKGVLERQGGGGNEKLNVAGKVPARRLKSKLRPDCEGAAWSLWVTKRLYSLGVTKPHDLANDHSRNTKKNLGQVTSSEAAVKGQARVVAVGRESRPRDGEAWGRGVGGRALSEGLFSRRDPVGREEPPGALQLAWAWSLVEKSPENLSHESE